MKKQEHLLLITLFAQKTPSPKIKTKTSPLSCIWQDSKHCHFILVLKKCYFHRKKNSEALALMKRIRIDWNVFTVESCFSQSTLDYSMFEHNFSFPLPWMEFSHKYSVEKYHCSHPSCVHGNNRQKHGRWKIRDQEKYSDWKWNKQTKNLNHICRYICLYQIVCTEGHKEWFNLQLLTDGSFPSLLPWII